MATTGQLNDAKLRELQMAWENPSRLVDLVHPSGAFVQVSVVRIDSDDGAFTVRIEKVLGPVEGFGSEQKGQMFEV